MSTSSHKLVAIHQPNFLPWLGYFNKIARSDVFIVMDNVQYPKKGGSWLNRVQMRINGKARWITVPVERNYHGTRVVREVKMSADHNWRTKIIACIQHNYRQAPYFEIIFPVITEIISNPSTGLADYNVSGIQALLKLLRINSDKLILGSLLDTRSHGTDLLISMVNAVGGTAYLSGGGAAEYQDDAKFGVAGIELVYQNFQHPVYSQIKSGPFVFGLSVVDALMNCGIEKTRALIFDS